MLLRRAEMKDVKSLACLEASSFKDPWPEKQIVYELEENPCSNVILMEENGEILGYLDFMITFDSATINRLAIDKEHRRRGIALALLNEMVQICQSQEDEVSWITLEVRKSNEAAISLYKKNGYERITIKRNYYHDGEDAIYMVRSILR